MSVCHIRRYHYNITSDRLVHPPKTSALFYGTGYCNIMSFSIHRKGPPGHCFPFHSDHMNASSHVCSCASVLKRCPAKNHLHLFHMLSTCCVCAPINMDAIAIFPAYTFRDKRIFRPLLKLRTKSNMLDIISMYVTRMTCRNLAHKGTTL
jgi:hypothetical protein